MNNKTNITVIIPTLQKNIKVLNKLLEVLVKDTIIEEIIVIDNSKKGINFSSEKIRLITPNKNLYVNPSWNLGISESKTEYFALFNDDLLVCENFCSKVLELIKNKDDFGILGMGEGTVTDTKDVFIPNPTDFLIQKNDFYEKPYNWGVIIFGKKSITPKIPKNLKIMCGDDFLRYTMRKNNLHVYDLVNTKIMHLESISSQSSKFLKIGQKEILEYAKIDKNFVNTHPYNWAKRGLSLWRKVQNIFSIRSSDDQKHKIITILGCQISVKKKSPKKLDKKDFLKLQNRNNKIVKRLRKKKKINITFMVSLSSMFPAQPLLEYLLKNKSKYNPKILIIPDFRFGFDNAYKLQEECYRELSKKYGTDIIIKSPIDKKEDNIKISKITDILFCSLPYDVSHKKYNLKNLINSGVLPAIVNYGYFRSSDYDRMLISSNTYSLYWKIFVENEQNLLEYKKYQIIGGDNCVLSGYCKMDAYKFYENKYNHTNKKTIMIAPHHSVQGGYNDVLMLSNFFKYSELFLELPKMYPDINFIFRPHPALFPCLEQKHFWSKEKIEKYVFDMKSIQNVRYSDGGNYLNDFAESDAIIQDCGSFLVDYFYTLKPQCYMLKNKTQIKENFSEFGQNCLKNVYQAFEKEDIINFINEVIVNGQDTKKEERELFAKQEVMINYPNVSATIVSIFNQIFEE